MPWMWILHIKGEVYDAIQEDMLPTFKYLGTIAMDIKKVEIFLINFLVAISLTYAIALVI